MNQKRDSVPSPEQTSFTRRSLQHENTAGIRGICQKRHCVSVQHSPSNMMSY
jgi:hypothetical protein